MKEMDRRDFLKLLGMGGVGVVFVSGLGNLTHAASNTVMKDGFSFVQMSDTHWGFTDAAVNPNSKVTLKKAVAAVNKLKRKPDFVIFTGDLTHNTDDPKERRKRMEEFKNIIKDLKVESVKFIPGEHDASMDNGEAFKEFFGKTHYTFDHKGVHFIALDNVSDPRGSLGVDQLQWLDEEMKKLDKDSQIIVLTHRPLFSLYPQWEWVTPDGAKAIDILMPFSNVTVFYGHIHQEHHDMTGHISHHAAKGLMYPLPAPGSMPKRSPVPWDPSAPYRGLGFRGIEAGAANKEPILNEYPIQES